MISDDTNGPRGISLVGKGIIGVSILWCVGTTAYFAHRSPDLALPSLALHLFFLSMGLVAAVEAPFQWSKRKWRALVPLGSFPLAVMIMWMAIPVARRAVFAWSFPSFESVVQEMEAGRIQVPVDLQQIPAAEAVARMTYAVRAKRTADGKLTVEFHTEGGFPALHSGYLYCSWCLTTEDASGQVAWPIEDQVKPRWFAFSN